MPNLKVQLGNKLSLSSKIFLKQLYAGFSRSFRRIASTFDSLKPPTLIRPPDPWNLSELAGIPRISSEEHKLNGKAAKLIRTSVIISVLNEADFTFQCLKSLFREIDLTADEVIVVNNASTDSTTKMLDCFQGFIRVINNETNQGFVGAGNQGASLAVGQYLVFLNNDTVVMPGWLTNLLDTIEKDLSIGAVGSMFLYPDHKIREAGSIIWKTGEAFHYGWGKSPDDRRYNFQREVDYCSGASLLIRRNLFEQLGGFDRRYEPAYYEDVDICFGVRSLGYKVVYQPRSRLIHFEGVTAGRDEAKGTKKFQGINRKKFYQKWQDVLEKEHFKNDPSLIEEASNRKPGPRFIVFDDQVPMPDRDAGSGRMFQILKLLAQLGHPLFVSLKPLPEYEQLLWKEGVETTNVVDYWWLMRKRNFQVAILSRPEVAEALIKPLRRAKVPKIIFDMVDAYFIRISREHKITGEQALAEKAQSFEKLELKLARGTDQVWCASSEDRLAISKHVPGDRIIVVPTIHNLQNRGKSFEEREGLLFIGSFAHRPNSDGINYFLREILPLIRLSLASPVFYIVGSGSLPELNKYQSDSVRILGYVPDIEPLLQGARVFVAPLRFGAGIKGKIGESLSYGLPVVTSSIGAEGFGFTPGRECLIADDAAEFANNVVQVYRNRALWQSLSDSGYRYVEEHLTSKVVGQTIETGLRRLGVLDNNELAIRRAQL